MEIDNLREDMIYAAFAAESASLASHWIYDRSEIAKHHPRGISGLSMPLSHYHEGKTAGDLTHYGDQALVLLESLTQRKSWSAKAWLEDWFDFWNHDPVSYRDGATSGTFTNLNNGNPGPSSSDDISAVSRMAPLLFFLKEKSLEDQIVAVREMVETTHGDSIVGDAAEFFVRSIVAVEEGKDFTAAFDWASSSGDYHSELLDGYQAATQTLNEDFENSESSFGQSCHTPDSFPLVVYLSLKYEDNPVQILEHNAMVGGDTVARAAILAILIAAQGKYPRLPAEWTDELRAKGRIDRALDSMEAN
tara:strand:- start:2725 stop:3639 length:915 start_codon:yes stop_codon:yes gene_type:complete